MFRKEWLRRNATRWLVIFRHFLVLHPYMASTSSTSLSPPETNASPSPASSSSPPPAIVFIVPYRGRPQQKLFFTTYMSRVLANATFSYEIYFSHQCDARVFNRGATKNIGFLAVKAKYPDHYRDMTFVFNDLDTVPYANILHYATEPGVVKHFYGFTYALGGIVALRGADFEAINGFPCFWGWGMEDNVLQNRCEKHGLRIDRSQFYPLGSPHILHLFDGVSRIINQKDPWRATHDDGVDGLRTLHKMQYTVDTTSHNAADNEHVDKMVGKEENRMFFVVNIATFMTRTRFENDRYYSYDLREPPRKILHPDRIRSSPGGGQAASAPITDDWSHIPYYPTAEQKKQWVSQYGAGQAEKLVEYNYQHSVDPTRPVVGATLSHPPAPAPSSSSSRRPFSTPSDIQRYNESMRNAGSAHRIIPPGINKFSPSYAKILAVKPRATASAHIRLGGVR